MRALRATFLAITMLPVGCAVSRRHSSDASLEANFNRHDAEFEALVKSLLADTKIAMINAKVVRYAGHEYLPDQIENLRLLGFTRQQWNQYQHYLADLGLVQIMQGEGSIELEVDHESLWNGVSRKGYFYDTSPPPGHQKPNLDQYEISKEDEDQYRTYILWRPIKKNWYLYLFFGRT